MLPFSYLYDIKGLVFLDCYTNDIQGTNGFYKCLIVSEM